MDVDDVSTDSVQAPPRRSSGDDQDSYRTPRDVLIYDEKLVCPGNQPRFYPVSRPIGYAVLLASDRTRHHKTHSQAIRKDLNLMKVVLNSLKWEVLSPCYNESTEEVTLTSNQWEKVRDYLMSRSSDLKQYSCFLFYFSGHGVSDRIILRDGESIEYEEIISEVSKIPSLQYKPKVFIFDCCRDVHDSEEEDEIPEKTSNENFDEDIREEYSSSIPDDTMVCFSASQGTKGWMESETGSIFTLQLTHSLVQFSRRLSLCEIITHVIGGTVRIARQALNRVQRPVFYSSMTRSLLLNEHCPSTISESAVYRESAHTEPLEPCNMGNNFEQKGPYSCPKGGGPESDIAKDAVTAAGQKVAKRSFTSKKDVEAHRSQLGEGVSVFIVYAPDPESPYFDPSTRKAQIDQNERFVFNLAYDLERHGFHVVTDLHLGDTQPSNWLQWYTSRIGLCDFVILVCSPAFNELFSHDIRPGGKIIDRRAQLLLNYKNAVYSDIMYEVKSTKSGGKFIPVILHPSWTVEECVPALFRAGAIYNVPGVEQGRTFGWDQDRDFEKLVCRMAGINRMELDKPAVVGVHQLGSRNRIGGGDFNDERLLEAARKRRKGYKVVVPSLGPEPGQGFHGGFSTSASTQPGFNTQTTFTHPAPQSHVQQAPPLPPPTGSAHVYPQQMQQLPVSSQMQHPAMMVPYPSPQSTLVGPPHPPLAAPPVVAMDTSTLPDKEPSPSIFLWLSDKIVRWKFIGRFLSLENHVLERIEMEAPGDVREQCYNMLDTWRVQRTSRYSYRTLGEQLLRSERNRGLYPEFVAKVTEIELKKTN